jgi:fermentation-respiration switch protein FrsA (DUF1100 family)
LHYPPEQIRAPKPREIWIEVAPSRKINGWYFENLKHEPPKGVVLFFHGNGENLSSHYITLLWLLEKGWDYLIFDYEGYGQTPGDPSPKTTLEDGVAALNWLSKEKPSTPLVVFGQSLGGCVALRSVLETKGEIPIRMVVVESTFESYQDAGRSMLSKSWVTWLFQPLAYLGLSDKYAPEDRLTEISPISLIVIHGDEDPVIDISLGRKVFEHAKEPKEFWSVPNGKHTDTFWGPHSLEYRQKLVEKLRTVEQR